MPTSQETPCTKSTEESKGIKLDAEYRIDVDFCYPNAVLLKIFESGGFEQLDCFYDGPMLSVAELRELEQSIQRRRAENYLKERRACEAIRNAGVSIKHLAKSFEEAIRNAGVSIKHLAKSFETARNETNKTKKAAEGLDEELRGNQK